MRFACSIAWWRLVEVRGLRFCDECDDCACFIT